MGAKAMQFKPTIDVWALSQVERAAIQPGQWVKAGPNGPRGQYLGQRKSGSDVVAWQGRHAFKAARRALRLYAIAK
jgi:hypothetical protein